MSLKTQGTDLYIIDPADNSLLVIGCTTSIDGVGSARATFTVPACLSDRTGTDSKSPGNLTPGSVSIGLNADPADDSHVRLHELLLSGDIVAAALGWSDGTSVPTVQSTGVFALPANRTWLTWEGFVSAFPFAFAANAVVATAAAFEMSAHEVWVPKAA